MYIVIWHLPPHVILCPPKGGGVS